jgi:AcrR family transcriptional regulator
MPSPVRADGMRNRTRLLEVAATAFAAGGTDSSLREIARLANVGIGTVYRHFPTREALVSALVQDQFDRLRTDGEHLLGSEHPLQALTDWLVEFAAASRIYPGLPDSVIAAINDRESDLHAAAEATHVTAAALLARAQASDLVRQDLAVSELLALVVGIAWADERSPTAHDLTRRLLGLAFEGLRARPSS